ncbi:hypothetical protein DFR74_11558 [Nocardia puris]|uniref:Uncharacterized protein n=1 Tax=Nocardia puris TaxID=208602 RepID=A0A366D5A2_9NOCA|nr:hypothetical protein DFR74_11558 [Nocardia puris]
MSEYDPESVMMSSGPCFPHSTTSRALSESRGVPDTTIPFSPAAWSFTGQVAPFFGPKYFRFARAWIVRTGTTNRIPSTLATRPPPHSCANATPA